MNIYEYMSIMVNCRLNSTNSLLNLLNEGYEIYDKIPTFNNVEYIYILRKKIT